MVSYISDDKENYAFYGKTQNTPDNQPTVEVFQLYFHLCCERPDRQEQFFLLLP